jgi:hypothetical protein
MSTHDWGLSSPDDVERGKFRMQGGEVVLTVMYETFENHPDRLTIEAYVQGDCVTSREIAVYKDEV